MAKRGSIDFPPGQGPKDGEDKGNGKKVRQRGPAAKGTVDRVVGEFKDLLSGSRLSEKVAAVKAGMEERRRAAAMKNVTDAVIVPPAPEAIATQPETKPVQPEELKPEELKLYDKLPESKKGSYLAHLAKERAGITTERVGASKEPTTADSAAQESLRQVTDVQSIAESKEGSRSATLKKTALAEFKVEGSDVYIVNDKKPLTPEQEQEFVSLLQDPKTRGRVIGAMTGFVQSRFANDEERLREYDNLVAKLVDTYPAAEKEQAATAESAQSPEVSISPEIVQNPKQQDKLLKALLVSEEDVGPEEKERKIVAALQAMTDPLFPEERRLALTLLAQKPERKERIKGFAARVSKPGEYGNQARLLIAESDQYVASEAKRLEDEELAGVDKRIANAHAVQAETKAEMLTEPKPAVFRNLRQQHQEEKWQAVSRSRAHSKLASELRTKSSTGELGELVGLYSGQIPEEVQDVYTALDKAIDEAFRPGGTLTQQQEAVNRMEAFMEQQREMVKTAGETAPIQSAAPKAEESLAGAMAPARTEPYFRESLGELEELNPIDDEADSKQPEGTPAEWRQRLRSLIEGARGMPASVAEAVTGRYERLKAYLGTRATVQAEIPEFLRSGYIPENRIEPALGAADSAPYIHPRDRVDLDSEEARAIQAVRAQQEAAEESARGDKSTEGWSESLRNAMSYLGTRAAELEKARSAWTEEYFGKLGESYNRLPTWQKVALSGSLAVGLGLTSGLPAAVYGAALIGTRFASFAGTFKGNEEQLGRISRGEGTGRLENTRLYKWFASGTTERDRKNAAMAKALTTSLGLTAGLGYIAKELSEHHVAERLGSWLGEHIYNATHDDAAISALSEAIPPPGQQTFGDDYGSSYEAMQTANPGYGGEGVDLPAEMPSGLISEASGAIPSIDVEVAAGRGYEWMTKRVWEQLQNKGFNPADYPEGSDIRRLLEIPPNDKAGIDKLVHDLAIQHGLIKPDGTSVSVGMGSHMTIDGAGNIKLENTIAEITPTAPTYAPEASAGTQLAPDISKPLEEVVVPERATISTVDLIPEQKANPLVSQPPSEGVMPTPANEGYLLDGSGNRVTDSEGNPVRARGPAEAIPQAPPPGVEGVVNQYGLFVPTNESHIYTDPAVGGAFAYGGSPAERANTILEYLTKNPNSIIYAADDTGKYRIPWVFLDGKVAPGAPVRTSGILGFFSTWMEPPQPNEFKQLIK